MNRFRVPMPGVQQPTGSGDLVKRIAEALGFRKPCGGCDERRRLLNQYVQLVPPQWPRRPR